MSLTLYPGNILFKFPKHLTVYNKIKLIATHNLIHLVFMFLHDPEAVFKGKRKFSDPF